MCNPIMVRELQNEIDLDPYKRGRASLKFLWKIAIPGHYLGNLGGPDSFLVANCVHVIGGMVKHWWPSRVILCVATNQDVFQIVVCFVNDLDASHNWVTSPGATRYFKQ